MRENITSPPLSPYCCSMCKPLALLYSPSQKWLKTLNWVRLLLSKLWAPLGSISRRSHALLEELLVLLEVQKNLPGLLIHACPEPGEAESKSLV